MEELESTRDTALQNGRATRQPILASKDVGEKNVLSLLRHCMAGRKPTRDTSLQYAKGYGLNPSSRQMGARYYFLYNERAV